MQSLKAAFRLCDPCYEWNVNDLLIEEYTFNELIEDSYLDLLDPFIRHDFIKDQSFCWSEEPKIIQLTPKLGQPGLCYVFNGVQNNFNQET